MVTTSDETNAILLNYQVSGGVFHIGTRGGRVSFHSQQLRAIQLATALARKYTDQKEKRILIIGGGIAGVTCLVALRTLGFANTSGYEAQDAVLQSQNSSLHRDAHPSANDWPMLLNEREFLSTTDLPFLNWYADKTPNVISLMKEDPKFLMYEPYFECGRIVHKVEVRQDGGVQVNYRNLDGTNKKSVCEILIFALGFGVERNLKHSHSGSYWWSDHVKHYRSEHQNYSGFKIYVSGTGDGGLIDYCRLCLAHGNTLDELEPNLAWSLIGALRKQEYLSSDPNWPDSTERASSVEKRIAKCFDEAFARRSKLSVTDADTVFAGDFRRIVDDFTLDTIEPGASNPLKEVYEFFRNQFRDASALDQIILLGRNSSPYEPLASPANALLAGFLIEEKPERFIPGEVTDKGPTIKMPPRMRIGRIRKAAIDGDFIHIARNGSEDYIPRLVDQCTTLKVAYKDRKKTGAANQFIIPKDFNVYGSPFDEPGIAQRIRLAQNFLDRYFFYRPQVDLVPLGEGVKPRFEVFLSDHDENARAARGLGGFDRSIFGLSVNYRSREYTASDLPELS